jgi:hypothetical protein
VCDGAAPIFRNKPIAVIGGGDSAMEEAMFLTKYGSEVSGARSWGGCVQVCEASVLVKTGVTSSASQVAWCRSSVQTHCLVQRWPGPLGRQDVLCFVRPLLLLGTSSHACAFLGGYSRGSRMLTGQCIICWGSTGSTVSAQARCRHHVVTLLGASDDMAAYVLRMVCLPRALIVKHPVSGSACAGVDGALFFAAGLSAGVHHPPPR